MSIIKLVSGILRHNHWGWGHVVEICVPPSVGSLSTLRKSPRGREVELLPSPG